MKRYVIKSTGELTEHKSGTVVTWYDHVKAITAVEAERDRLRNENAEYLAMLDADAHRLTMAQATIDRLREALSWARMMIIETTTSGKRKYYRPTMDKIDAALQEDNDD